MNTIVNAIRVYQPAMARVFERLLPYYYTDKEQEMVDELFPTCENISVDYAVMEKQMRFMYFRLLSDGATWVPGVLFMKIPSVMRITMSASVRI